MLALIDAFFSTNRINPGCVIKQSLPPIFGGKLMPAITVGAVKNPLSTFTRNINESLRLIFESPALRRLFNIDYADGKIIW